MQFVPNHPAGFCNVEKSQRIETGFKPKPPYFDHKEFRKIRSTIYTNHNGVFGELGVALFF